MSKPKWGRSIDKNIEPSGSKVTLSLELQKQIRALPGVLVSVSNIGCYKSKIKYRSHKTGKTLVVLLHNK